MVKAILQTVVFLLLLFFVCLCVLWVSRILQNYAKWQLVFTLLPDLGSEFKDIHDTLQGMIGSESSYYTLVFNSAQNTTYNYNAHIFLRNCRSKLVTSFVCRRWSQLSSTLLPEHFMMCMCCPELWYAFL